MGDFDAGPPEHEADILTRARLPRTDVGNGRRLRMAHGDSVRYVPGRGWIVWNGRIWEAEFGDTAILSVGETLPDLVLAEAAALAEGPVSKHEIAEWLKDNDSDDQAAARKAIKSARKKTHAGWAKTCGALARINAALTLLRDHCRARVIDLDAKPFSVTAQNGEIDLEALAGVDLGARATADPDDPDDVAAVEREIREALAAAQRPFDKAGLSTRMLGCDFDPSAEAPRWRRFLEIALPDPEMRAFAQRLAGYLLSGRNEAQIALVLLGPGGNGKSTFMAGLSRVLGTYAAACRIEMFLESRTATQGPTPEEAILPGARAYPASEPEPGATLSSSKIKGMTGGERRLAHAKGKDPFEWLPQGVPILSFNKVPRITDESDGMWRRLTFLPFGVYLPALPGDQRVSPAEMERIVDAEASGILNWMVEGWIAYRASGLAPPAEADEIKARQRALADPIGEFLADCTVSEPATSLQSSEMHKVFEKWCEANGTQPHSIVKFSKTLLDKGFVRSKVRGVNVWRFLAWNPSDDVWQLRLKADPEARP